MLGVRSGLGLEREQQRLRGNEPVRRGALEEGRLELCSELAWIGLGVGLGSGLGLG